MKFLALLLTCLPCFAQFPYSGVAWSLTSAASLPGPSSISNLRYWWHSADMTTNTAVTNWIDEIQGSIWTNGSTSLQPTNSALGVGFDGSTWMTNTAPFFIKTDTAGTGTVYLVWNPQSSATALGGVLGDTTSGGNGIYVTSGAQVKMFSCCGGSAAAYNFVGGVTYDFAMIMTNASLGQYLLYTNNVFINNSSGTGDFGNKTTYLGRDGEGSAPKMKGNIRDIIIYYGALTPANVSTLHTYFTNLYKYSP